MTNTSIYAAFERFWQHVVALIGNKFVAGDNVTITPDEANNKMVISATNNLYVQSSEPSNAIPGSLWVDTDESPVEIEEFETWTFTLEDGTTVTKNVKVGI